MLRVLAFLQSLSAPTCENPTTIRSVLSAGSGDTDCEEQPAKVKRTAVSNKSLRDAAAVFPNIFLTDFLCLFIVIHSPVSSASGYRPCDRRGAGEYLQVRFFRRYRQRRTAPRTLRICDQDGHVPVDPRPSPLRRETEPAGPAVSAFAADKSYNFADVI